MSGEWFEIYAGLMLLLDYPQFLNIIYASLHAGRVVWHIETAKVVLDSSENIMYTTTIGH